MAKQMIGLDISLKAGADLSTKQYYMMEQSSTNDQVSTVNAATDTVIGVLQNKPSASGYEAAIRIVGHTKVIAGETLTAGNIFGANARGSATALTPGTSTTAYAVGQITYGGASGAYIEGVVIPGILRSA